MAWNPLTINHGAVVVDANAAIAIAARENLNDVKAKNALAQYSANGFLFYAPGVIVSETLHALCQKQQNGLLNPTEYALAILEFDALMRKVLPPPKGDASLILRADQIRAGYGCSRSADAVYIALAEELLQTSTTRLLTFDQDLPKQAARNAPTVNIHLLT